MTIRIALTNLGKYNEGELVYTWLELPATDEDIQEALEKIGIDGVRYEEYFISDYEAPFEIGEYENIDKLNYIADRIEELRTFEKIAGGEFGPEDLINFSIELEDNGYIYDRFEYVGNIIHDEDVDSMVRNMIDTGDGWARVAIFLHNASKTAEWHWIDGYGNLDYLTSDRLETIAEELLNEAMAAIEDEWRQEAA
jgi:Antirestriction protein (ArdA)